MLSAGRMPKDPGRRGAWEAEVTTILSTDGMARHEREGFWRQALSETFVPMTVRAVTQDRFGGLIRSDWIGRLMVAEVASTAQDVHRTSREMSRTDAEYLQIGMVYRGVGRVAQDSREAVLEAGDFAVFETTRPFRWSFGGDWDVGAFTLPRGSVGLSEAESRLLCARRLDGQSGITGVVSRFLRDLGRHADRLSGTQSERVLADVTDLVVTLLGDWVDGSDAVRSSVQRSLLFRIKDYIDRRLADPTLGPAEIAAAVNISTGTCTSCLRPSIGRCRSTSGGCGWSGAAATCWTRGWPTSRSRRSRFAGASATSAASTGPSGPPSAPPRGRSEHNPRPAPAASTALGQRLCASPRIVRPHPRLPGAGAAP
jgi:hypothetical protein